jgi:hypothetical protein
VSVSRPNWSRKLPRPLKIPTVTTLTTLADVGELMKDLPDQCQERGAWQHAAPCVARAALRAARRMHSIALRLVLMLESVECRPQ